MVGAKLRAQGRCSKATGGATESGDDDKIARKARGKSCTGRQLEDWKRAKAVK
jgi:hypothetical protein